MSHVTTIAAALFAAMTAVACSSDRPAAAPATTVPFGSNVTTIAPTAPVVSVADSAGLSAFVPQAPGFTRAGATSDNGPFDATTGVLRFHQNDAEARQRLDAGLAGGYASTLAGPSGEVVGIQLYAFNDPTEATAFSEYIQQHAMQGVAHLNFSLPGVADLVGFVIPQGGGSAGAALFVKGRYLVYIGVTSTTGDVRAQMQTLVRAQFDLLPAA